MDSTTFFGLLIFFGCWFHPYYLVEGVDPNDEHVYPRNVNTILERLTAQLSNIPTKDDLSEKIGVIEARFADKFEGLEISIRNLEALIRSSLGEGKDQRGHINMRRNRRSPNTLDIVNSDYRLGILASEVRKSAFNETCNIMGLLLNVQSDQVAALEEIRNTSTNISQHVGTMVTELKSLNNYINKLESAVIVEPKLPKCAVTVFNTAITWEQAKTYCNTRGLNLATVESQEKYDCILGTISSAGLSDATNYWTAANDLAQEGSFLWDGVGTRVAQFYPVGNVQPDNGEGREHCVSLRKVFPGTVFSSHHMNDEVCDHQFATLCE